jgi:hypothetical protein
MRKQQDGRHRFPAGNPGRPKGVPNKITTSLKEMILTALSDAGGVAYLQRQAEENPGPFLALVGKVLPLQVEGSDGTPLHITVITGVPQPGDPDA